MQKIDDYLANLPKPQKSELERIRNIVSQTVPDAEESWSYGMPAFKYKKKYLIGYFAFKDHMSVFPGSAPIEVLRDKLSGYKLSKGTIQFTLENPLPEKLIKEIVQTSAAKISS